MALPWEFDPVARGMRERGLHPVMLRFRGYLPGLSEGFDVSLCLLDYPREDLCDQSTWGGAERGFVRASS